METLRICIASIVLVTAVGAMQAATGHHGQAAPLSPPCARPGWFPTSFGLKDHSVFRYNSYYYLVAIYWPLEDRFAYGRSPDLCTWEDLSPILARRNPGTWDEHAIWAPYVYEETGLYHMYYTGIMTDHTQSIMLATSSDPADPDSWQVQGMIFQPHHQGMVWQVGSWANCRDPMVLRVAGTYYLFYTGTDEAGGIVGVATASSPLGPWHDWGAVLTMPGVLPESPTVFPYSGLYYLFYNEAGKSEHHRIGPGPTGPWTTQRTLAPGWAHEVWQGADGYTYTSFLTDYTVTISRLAWDTFLHPPLPFIGEQVYHLLLPLIVR